MWVGNLELLLEGTFQIQTIVVLEACQKNQLPLGHYHDENKKKNRLKLSVCFYCFFKKKKFTEEVRRMTASGDAAEHIPTFDLSRGGI